jgi:hypothetical protein
MHSLTIKVEENIYPDYFNGYCPESWLKGKTVRMRLNVYDFFESEATGLQIAIIHPGVQAVVIKWRGMGRFKENPRYADETEMGEFLLEQCSDRWPYCGKIIIRDIEHLRRYIERIT